MYIGSGPLRSDVERVIGSSILGTTARSVSLILLYFFRCISPHLLVDNFCFSTSSDDKDWWEIHSEICARLGEYLQESLWNHSWSSIFLLYLNFDLYYEVNLASEHWKWGCTGKYLLRYMSIFTVVLRAKSR